MPRRVLVSAIGFNPSSAVIAGRHYAVDRAVLVGSPQMDAVAAQLNVPTTPIAFESASAMIGDVHRELNRTLHLASDERVVLDVTGGTKLLALGVWNAMMPLPHDRIDPVYLLPNGQLVNPVTGEAIEQRVRIGIDEVLAWQGAQCGSATWHGMLADVDRDIARRARLGAFLVSALADRRLRVDARRNRATITRGPILTKLPQGVSVVRENQLQARQEDYFSTNIWLEEVCLQRARAVLRNCAVTQAAMGQHMAFPGNAGDEADVVLVRGARTCVIEAKARRQGSDVGADLDKRISKTKEFFGSHAAVIFVHPAWGTNPPHELVRRTERSAYLVGGDLAALDRAIASALQLKD